MKRFLITLTGVLIVWPLFANPVDENRARKVADSFLFSKHVETKGVYPVKISGLARAGRPSIAPSVYNHPAYYLYSLEDCGFILVAGDDVARPILAYSFQETLDPDHLTACQQSWLDNIGNTVYYAIAHNILPSQKTKDEWSSLSLKRAPERANDVVIETAAWNQWGPYNKYAPVLFGKQCPTGCVNTAEAIIMRYYKWPQRGIGHLGTYSYTATEDNQAFSNTVEGHDLGHEYDWNNMPLKYVNYNDSQAEQVAILMNDLGVMNQTHYAPSGSGAYVRSGGLNSNFFYHTAVEKAFWGSDLSTMNKTLRDEINQGRLVLMSGQTDDPEAPGHAFVICGYSGDYYCFNMGWGGGSSVFQLLTPIDGSNDDVIEYHNNVSFMYNIQPLPSDQLIDQPYIEFLGGDNTNWYYESKVPFFIRNYRVRYRSNSIQASDYFPINVAWALVDVNKEVKEIVSEEMSINSAQLFFENTVCQINGDFEEGDEIALCFKKPNEQTWHLMSQAEESSIKLTRHDSIDELISFHLSEENILYMQKPSNISFEFVSKDANLGGCKYSFKDMYDFDGRGDGFSWNSSGIRFSRRGDEPETWTITFRDISSTYTMTIVL